MEVKVNQWVRTERENIYQVIENHTLDAADFFYQCHINGKKEYGYIAKVADTPQELVQGEDLISHNESENDNDVFKVKSVCNDGTVILRGSVPIFTEYITKILTPNSKGGYDLQWEK